MGRPLTVRDLRLHWPEAERRLRREREIVVTRDGKPVARLSAFVPDEARRPRFSPEAHLAWLGQTWKGRATGKMLEHPRETAAGRPSTDELLAKDRDG